MTEMGESVFVPKPPQKEGGENDESKQTIRVRLLLFFDGTANNRTNVDERENNTELYQSLDNQWLKLREYRSYNNAKTNIAHLESNVDPKNPPEPFDHAVSIYIEGSGTEDGQRDRRRGLAIGTGSTGIKAKVNKGIELAVENMRDIIQDRDGEASLKLLTIDLFGFSRGAASARHCIHRLMDEGGEPIAERLEVEGFPAEKIEINFVGLFDTVSSHGVSFANDVGVLNLDAIACAKRVVQLEASEEYRENFSLTTIDSAGGKGRRICLPGAHADVGGGYPIGEEAQIVFRGHQRDRSADRDWLVAQGWYRPDELTLPTSRDVFNHIIHAERSRVKVSYSKIPLTLMADFIKEEGMMMDSIEFPGLIDMSKESELLQELQTQIEADVASGVHRQPRYWQERRDSLLRAIRNQYLHLSAHYSSMGMAPRLHEGQRRRQEYEG